MPVETRHLRRPQYRTPATNSHTSRTLPLSSHTSRPQNMANNLATPLCYLRIPTIRTEGRRVEENKGRQGRDWLVSTRARMVSPHTLTKYAHTIIQRVAWESARTSQSDSSTTRRSIRGACHAGRRPLSARPTCTRPPPSYLHSSLQRAPLSQARKKPLSTSRYVPRIGHCQRNSSATVRHGTR